MSGRRSRPTGQNKQLLRGTQLPLVDDVSSYDLPIEDKPTNGNGQKFRGQNQPETDEKRTLNVDALIRASADLCDRELQQLHDAIGALLSTRNLGDREEAQSTKNRTLNADDRLGRGSIEEKKINGCGPYRYLRWWSGGKHRSTYLGKVEQEE